MKFDESGASVRRYVKLLERRNALLARRVSRLEQALARVRHVACHDLLTGLPNRHLLLDRLKQATLQAERRHKSVGVLLLDLDGFKRVNDELGHTAGDQLLQQVAERLSDCMRGGDTVCRYGGDEFVIMLPEIGGAEDAEAVAQKIRALLLAPYKLGGTAIRVSASVGAAIFRPGQPDGGELIEEADLAMYRAKGCLATRKAAAGREGHRDG
jgi:diguanylate cyclase